MQQTTSPDQTHRKKLAARTKVALWLIIAPSLLIFLAFFLFALTNYIAGSFPDSAPASCVDSSSNEDALSRDEDCQESLFQPQSPAITVINVLLYVAGGIGVVSWIPGLIIGIVLLVTRPKV